jgi:hypothetical protein
VSFVFRQVVILGENIKVTGPAASDVRPTGLLAASGSCLSYIFTWCNDKFQRFTT